MPLWNNNLQKAKLHFHSTYTNKTFSQFTCDKPKVKTSSDWNP